MQKTDYDVAIVGAGAVGASLACLLAPIPLRIALIDSKAPPAYRSDRYDLRVISVNRASRRVLQSFGVWASIEARRVSPFRHIRVWDDGGEIAFHSAELGEPELGHIVEMSAMLEALHARIADEPQIDLFCPAKINRIDYETDSVTVALEGTGPLRAKLIVGADGARSRVRRTAGIAVSATSYAQRAIVAQIDTALAHEHTARQRFLRTGPVALLPLADGSSSIVWSCDRLRARELLVASAADFAEQLAAALQQRVGNITMRSERRGFPLWRSHADRYIAARTALVGDAAHVVHPLAGLGLNLGIMDAAALAEVLSESLAGKRRDAGAYPALRRYERWRRTQNAIVINLMDAFKHSFGSDNSALAHVRNLGLRIADGVTPMKHLLMRHAMGLAGDLPRAAQADHPQS